MRGFVSIFDIRPQAANYEPNDDLYKELEGKVTELYLVGDAKGVRVQFIGNLHVPYRLALKN
jgi:hypothetical protein